MREILINNISGIAVGDAKGISYEMLTKEQIMEIVKKEDPALYHRVR